MLNNENGKKLIKICFFNCKFSPICRENFFFDEIMPDLYIY